MNNKFQYTLSNLLVIVIIIVLSYYYMAKFVYNNNQLELTENFMNSGLTYSITDPNNYFITNTNVDTSLPFLQFPNESSYNMTIASLPTFIGKSFTFEGFYKITGFGTLNRFLQLFEVNSDIRPKYEYKLSIGFQNDGSNEFLKIYIIKKQDSSAGGVALLPATKSDVESASVGSVLVNDDFNDANNYVKITLTYNFETEKDNGNYSIDKTDYSTDLPTNINNNAWNITYSIVNINNEPVGGKSINFIAPIFAIGDDINNNNNKYKKSVNPSTSDIDNSILNFNLTNKIYTTSGTNASLTQNNELNVIMYKCSIKNNI